MAKLDRRFNPIQSLSGPPLVYMVFGLVCTLALAVRVALFHVVTDDYTMFLSPWYDFIQSNGGFAAMKHNFSNYNPPYLYLLAIATYLPIPKLVAIKLISVMFDLVLALFTYLILRLKYQRSYVPMIGAAAMLLAPTILINSSAWGQCDSIYAAFCVGSLYFLLTKRWAWASVFFGLAIAFKLQAIFFLPVLLLVALKQVPLIRYLPLIPAVFLLLLVPAYVAGRDVTSLLSVYVEQVSTGGVGVVVTRPFNEGQGMPPRLIGPSDGQGMSPRFITPGQPGTDHQVLPVVPGDQFSRPMMPMSPGNQLNGPTMRRFGGGFNRNNQFTSLTYNAPTIYQWLGSTALARNKWVGIGLAAIAVAVVGGLLVVRKTRLDADVLLHMSLVCVLAIPFFLPNMHERYFYLADVVSVIYAFWFPRSFYLPLLMQLASLLSYAPYLLDTELISLTYVAVVVLALVLIVGTKFVQITRTQATLSPVLG